MFRRGVTFQKKRRLIIVVSPLSRPGRRASPCRSESDLASQNLLVGNGIIITIKCTSTATRSGTMFVRSRPVAFSVLVPREESDLPNSVGRSRQASLPHASTHSLQ